MPSGGRDDDAVVGREAGGDLDLLAEVAGDRHRLEQDLVVGADGRDPQAVLVEDQRAGGDVQRRPRRAAVSCRTLAKPPGISSPPALSSASCIRVVPEATSTACDEASTVAAKVRFGIFRHRDHGLGADLDRRHVVLRHVDVDAQLA